MEFYRSRPIADLPATVWEAFLLQLLAANPGTMTIWVPGLLYLLFSRRARPYRPLGITFVVLFFVVLFSGQRRADRIVGIYPVVLAAGATLWDRWRGRGHRAVRWVLVVALLLFGGLVLPATLPVLPPVMVASYFEDVLGEKPDIEKADVGQPLPLHFVGRLEWERFAEEVIAAWDSLPADERQRAVILAPHWLFASVVEYYGRERELPPIVAPHNAYWFWRDEIDGRDLVVAVGVETEVLSRYFGEARLLHVFRCRHCATFRPDLPIVLCTRPVRPLQDLFAQWKHFGIDEAPALR
jgi:hypothetical protein